MSVNPGKVGLVGETSGPTGVGKVETGAGLGTFLDEQQLPAISGQRSAQIGDGQAPRTRAQSLGASY